jgi:hypothetical protein
MFNKINLMARPIVALARQQGPNAPDLLFIFSFLAIGPLTIMSGATGCVVGCISASRNFSSAIASIAAIITGMYSGRQPAMTALIAIFSTVASPQHGGIVATTSEGFLLVPAIIFSVAWLVGGIIGNPSLQPFSINKLFITSTESSMFNVSEENFRFIFTTLLFYAL